MADNKTIQKIFSLGDLRKKQLVNEIPERTRESYREFGYFIGGRVDLSLVERVDYSNDSVVSSRRGPLSTGRRSLGSAGNSNYGYATGGSNPGGSLSSVERIDYANDSASTSIRGPLSNATGINYDALSNVSYGYFYNSRDYYRIDFSNDLNIASIRTSNLQRRDTTGAAGNADYGWIAGGDNNIGGSQPQPALDNYIERIDYSNDTQNPLLRGNLGIKITGLSGTGNPNYGWFGGGFYTATTQNFVQKLDYSNDLANTSTRASLSQSRWVHASTGNSNFGYYGAGTGAPATTSSEQRTSVSRIDFANDTGTSLSRGPLTAGRYSLSATSSHSFGGTPNSSYASNFTFPTVPNAGYFGGGNRASIDKVDYANDTATASVRSALSLAKTTLAATGNSNFGYFGGGQLSGPIPAPQYSTIDRLEYSSDTQNVITRANLLAARSELTATGNSNFGYFGGGYFPGNRAEVYRLDYASDTSTTSRGSLTIARSRLGATGNSNFGYFGGGNPGPLSIIDRIDYSNDLDTPLTRGPLSLSRQRLSAVSNQNFGYFAGGDPVSSIIERLDYSNDTTIASRISSFSQANARFGSTGNSNFGYFGGGSGPLSTIDRIDYSNDTSVASIRGPLSTGKSSLAATSPLGYGGAPIYFTNPLPEVFQKQIVFNDSNTLDLPFKRVLGSYGYYGGGAGPESRVDRIDYSNDTATASVRGPLSSARTYLAGTGNSNFGYFGKGSSLSSIQRINYSNDNATAILRSNASNSLNTSASFSNNSYGYFCGGRFPISSVVDRIDFSADTIISTRGNLISARGEISASSTQNFGYIYGGREPVSFIQRINISNDLSVASFRGNLSSVKNSTGATGNSIFGYCGGGRTTSGGGSQISTVDRIDYSNDTATASVRGPLSSAGTYGVAATGNSKFGYFSGASGSRVDRIDYSNDTATASVRGPLSLARRYLAATTNARNS
jgi:hypothetical protein